jgi:hypothetical protein
MQELDENGTGPAAQKRAGNHQEWKRRRLLQRQLNTNEGSQAAASPLETNLSRDE